MQKKIFCFCFVCMLVIIISCNQKTETPETSSKEDVKTPVTVTTISTEPLNDSVEINATSSFLQGNIVKSNINGYIKSVNTKPGQHAAAGQTLFIIKTKEAENLGNTINKLDPSFHFSGVVHITASQSGYLTFLNHQVGDYVQDGEQLAVISNSNSFGFMLNIPFELRKYVSLNKKVEVILPDGTHLNGTISSFMPTIDSIGQTQGALVKVPSSTAIPANLIAKVRILKTAKSNVPSLPKQAILTNEAQTSFWIMKMIDSVTAIKVSVIKGLETGNRVEIISPRLSPDDKILLNGNYGLPDTAKVQIIKGEQ